MFEPERLPAVIKHPKSGELFAIQDSCLSQDAVGDWSLCLLTEVPKEEHVPAPCEEVGIDLGLSHIATTSDGEIFEHGRWYRTAEEDLAYLQRQASWYEQRNKPVPKGIRERIRSRHE